MHESERPVRRVQHVGFPDQEILINAEDFDPAVHREAGMTAALPSRDDRARTLAELPAAEIKALAEQAGVAYQNKASAIEALVEREFPTEQP